MDVHSARMCVGVKKSNFFAFCELAKSMRNVRCWWTLPAAPSHQLGCRPEIWIRYVTLYTPTPTKKPFFVNDFHRMRMRSLKQSKKEQNFHLNFSPNIRKRFHFFSPVFLFEGTKQHTKKARDISNHICARMTPEKGIKSVRRAFPSPRSAHT